MKKTILTFCAASMLLFACGNDKKDDAGKKDESSSTTTTGETKKDEPWVPVDSATIMAKMMEVGTPGPMHAMIKSWSGTWNGETTMWDYEGAAPTKSTGTAVNKMVVGDKYQMSTHTGNMMGMPFEGMSFLAYDNATKKFVSTWIDNWGTGIMTMTGNWDEGTKTLTMSGTYPDIVRPGKECSMREVFKIVDADTQLMEMYGPDQKTGKEFKMMEMKMTRKK